MGESVRCKMDPLVEKRSFIRVTIDRRKGSDVVELASM